MEGGQVTTPFGRRQVTLALVRRQIATSRIEEGKSANKWKVFRDASEAREVLGLQDRSLAVLDALLSFYPENELRQDAQLIVFPSNIQLSIRAHGIAGATLRRHLALLVEAGLIIRKDSANGKRYARKDNDGSIEHAFGFDISPLLMRAEELACLAQQVAADRIAFRRAKENLTICRRDIRKLITAAVEEGAAGDWDEIEERYIALVREIPRSPSLAELGDLGVRMSSLREDIVKLLNSGDFSSKMNTSDAQIERHIQNSNTNPPNELEPSSRNELEAKPSENGRTVHVPIKAFPIGLVLRACPEISNYGPGGEIRNWRELMTAAVVVRSMLGVSPSAYQEACEVMGPENAAVTIACILERGGHINSAGGYLRDLTSKAKRGEFSLGPVLMALLRAGGHNVKAAG
ncbi:plasmid replication protein RepC [Agrobacterium radiobacter]|uniref:plasmid replication protein RepC n=1 Tax=Agrobacterium radiobacter TaxID=362 RepID=UPI00035D2E9C|nr:MULTISPECIES: plasmid replication protein RepC [Agrobacterium tumefaciens complex]HET6408572.1 plasmid replication protein RepC [Chthoniobacteraceae bacterium]EPR23277.1 replication initiation protein [Agrobacterium radiobacter DSM 30147]KAB0459197.1 replication initiation protein RepC [Agrobacterium tumefaciens]KWT75403.1 replication initiation protein RepC [Agrobacterium radiobacter]MBB4409488.1 replication initiation protein RepC [Agrobacterium radiobacter]